MFNINKRSLIYSFFLYHFLLTRRKKLNHFLYNDMNINNVFSMYLLILDSFILIIFILDLFIVVVINIVLLFFDVLFQLFIFFMFLNHVIINKKNLKIFMQLVFLNHTLFYTILALSTYFSLFFYPPILWASIFFLFHYNLL